MQAKTYPLNKITPTRISIEHFVVFQRCCNLSYNLFANSIINRYRPNLKIRLFFTKLLQHKKKYNFSLVV